MAKERTFPFEFEEQKEILFYPAKPDKMTGDILEIGPGRGDWLLAQAEANPDKKFVAVEIGKPRYFGLIPRMEKKKLTNILLIRGDARLVLPRHMEAESFEKVFVLFPDPWPKDRHRFRRLLSVEFLNLLSHQIKPGGSFHFATDHMPYAESVTENLTQVPSLSPHPEQKAHEPFPNYEPTFFEKKWREEGKEIVYLSYLKAN